MIDPASKAPGRGAYIHDRRECWEAALKGSLARALRADITAVQRLDLMKYMEQLPERSDG
jgi:predicted RNA-binding protein YlxR (DUF448 family)